MESTTTNTTIKFKKDSLNSTRSIYVTDVKPYDKIQVSFKQLGHSSFGV